MKRQPFIIGEAPLVAADAAPPSPATTHAAASIYSQDDVYTRLANLMEWKHRGWLSDTEFEAAKALLLQAPRPQKPESTRRRCARRLLSESSCGRDKVGGAKSHVIFGQSFIYLLLASNITKYHVAIAYHSGSTN